MASAPRIVAELGRPETPDETAARKAASSAAYRSSQTFRSLIAALLATVAIVAVIVFAVPRGELAEPAPADVVASAQAASESLGRPVVAPATPEGWRPNSAEIVDGTWRIVYAPSSGFVRVAQRFDADETWVTTTLDGRAPSGSVEIAGVVWDEYDHGAGGTGNITYALATAAGTDTILIYGSTSAKTAAIAAEAVADDILTLRGAQQ